MDTRSASHCPPEEDPGTRRRAAEAPAKLWSGVCKKKSVSASPLMSSSSEPVQAGKLLQRKPFHSDLDRDEAWEKKRDLFLVGELDGLGDYEGGGDGGEEMQTIWQKQRNSKGRSRSLTDEDLEELRGSIDLGFGFSHHESFDLRATLPALDLYCAINRHYNDMKIPVSPLADNSLQRSSSIDSYGSPVSESWRISSPGDNPNQVKARLRHWAQAVACSVRQSSF